MVGRCSLAADSGTRAKRCPMVFQLNLMKMHLLFWWISLDIPIAQLATNYSLILIKILTLYLIYWGYLGRSQRPFLSQKQSFTWALNGTSQHKPYRFLPTRKRNISQQSKCGRHRRFTPWRKLRNYMGSYYMPAIFFQLDAHTLPAWRPSWGLSHQIHLLHTILLDAQLQTSIGGSTNLTKSASHSSSQAHKQYQIEEPSQMQVQVLALALLSVTNGEHGSSSLAGKQRAETSAGQRQSALSPWPMHYIPAAPQVNISRSLETIGESSKAGEQAEVKMQKQIRSSDAFTASQTLTNAIVSLDTSPVVRTQQTHPPEEFTLQLLTSSQLLRASGIWKF